MQKQEDSRLEVVFGDSDKVDVWHNNVKVLEQISEAEFREYLDKLLDEGWKVSSTFNEGAGSELYFLRRTRT